MPTFALKQVEAIAAKETVYQLVLNGKNQLDLFEKDVNKSGQKRQFARLLNVLERAANGEMLPKDKFHPHFPPSSSRITLLAYECKHEKLRLYLAQLEVGKVVVLAGFKNEQDGDIPRFESLLAQLESDLDTLTYE